LLPVASKEKIKCKFILHVFTVAVDCPSRLKNPATGKHAFMQIKKYNSTILTFSGYQCVTVVLSVALYRGSHAQMLRNKRVVWK